jgi:hypothetical protein
MPNFPTCCKDVLTKIANDIEMAGGHANQANFVRGLKGRTVEDALSRLKPSGWRRVFSRHEWWEPLRGIGFKGANYLAFSAHNHYIIGHPNDEFSNFWKTLNDQMEPLSKDESAKMTDQEIKDLDKHRTPIDEITKQMKEMEEKYLHHKR